MSQDEFSKLFTYMERRFDAIEAELAKKVDKSEIDRINATLDAILKNQETDDQERLVIAHQLNRHERWIERAADRLKITYNAAE